MSMHIQTIMSSALQRIPRHANSLVEFVEKEVTKNGFDVRLREVKGNQLGYLLT